MFHVQFFFKCIYFVWIREGKLLRERPRSYPCLNILNPNIQIQILHTNVHTLTYRIGWENLIKDQSISPLFIMLLIKTQKWPIRVAWISSDYFESKTTRSNQMKFRLLWSELFLRLTSTFRVDAPPPRPKVEKPIHKGGGNGLLVPSLSLPPSVTPRVCLLGHI